MVMQCYCDYDDQPSFQTTDFVKARKDHKCYECGKIIKPGEVYQRIKGMWDGHWEKFDTCEACADLRDSLNEVWCVYLGELRGEYMEYLTEIGAYEYNEELDEYIYPENHMNLNRKVRRGRKQT